MFRDKCYFPDLAESLRENLWQLDRVRSISPYDPDLMRLKEALRERIADLEGYAYTDDRSVESSGGR